MFNLYNFDWPIYTSYGPQPPVKFAPGEDGHASKTLESLLRPGSCRRRGDPGRCCRRRRSSVPAHRSTDAVLMNGVRVGAGAVVRNAILDKHVVVPPGARIGVDPAEDEARGFLVQDGLAVLGKGQVLPS